MLVRATALRGSIDTSSKGAAFSLLPLTLFDLFLFLMYKVSLLTEKNSVVRSTVRRLCVNDLCCIVRVRMNVKLEVLVVKPPKDDDKDDRYFDITSSNRPARFLTFLVRNKKAVEDRIFKAFPVDSVYRTRCGWLVVERRHPLLSAWKIRGIVKEHNATVNN